MDRWRSENPDTSSIVFDPSGKMLVGTISKHLPTLYELSDPLPLATFSSPKPNPHEGYSNACTIKVRRFFAPRSVSLAKPISCAERLFRRNARQPLLRRRLRRLSRLRLVRPQPRAPPHPTSLPALPLDPRRLVRPLGLLLHRSVLPSLPPIILTSSQTQATNPPPTPLSAP